MAKLAPVSAALLAGLLLVTLAAATTTVTTVEVNEGEDNPYRGYGRRFGGVTERCREQLEEANELRDCEDFLREQAREGGFGRRRFAGMDPYERYGGGQRRFGGGEGGRGSRRLRNCCQQLRQMDDRCRCEGLREIVRDQQQRQRGYGEEREELERIAENLPQMCGVSPGRCDIRGGGRWM